MLCFFLCIAKIGGSTTDSADDLDLVMPMSNLIIYSSNYSKTTNFNADVTNTDNCKCFKCKTKTLENTATQPAFNSVNGILKMQHPLTH